MKTPEDNKQSTTNAQAATQANTQQQFAGSNQQGAYQPGSFTQHASPFAALGVPSRGSVMGGEQLTQLVEGLTARAQNEARDIVNISVIPVPGNELRLPMIAMAARAKNGTVAVYTLMIEAMISKPLEPVYNNQQTPTGTISTIIDMPTVRCFDNTARSVISNAVARQMNVDLGQIALLAPFVIPKSMDFTQVDKQGEIFYSALMALVDSVGGAINRIDASLLGNPALEVQLRTQFTASESRVNRVGRLVASDFHSTINLVDTTQNRQQGIEVHAAPSHYNVVEATGYIDFNILDNPNQNFNPLAAQMGHQVQPQPGYIPIAVLTDISASGTGNNVSEDLGTVLMALISTMPVGYNYGWTRLFESQPGHQSMKTSLGYLGVEHDPLGRGPEAMGVVKVESGVVPSEAVETPLSMAMKYCTQAVAVAVDIEAGSRLEWVLSILRAAAAEGQGENNEDILNEAERLAPGTRGIWAEMNGGNGHAAVMEQGTVLVHLGTYRGTDDKIRDIRVVDYLSMVALFEKNKDTIQKATAATVPAACNDQTLTDRRNVLVEATGCTIDGLATRVFVKPNFLAAFFKALQNNNIQLRSNDLMVFGGHGNRVGMSAGYAGNFAPGTLIAPTYSQGPGQYGMTSLGWNSMFTGRQG